MTIFEINREIAEILEGNVDEETGELLIDTERLEQLNMDRQEKLEHCGAAAKEYEAKAQAVKTLMDSLKKKYEGYMRRAKSAADFLEMNLEEGETIESERVKVYRRYSETTEISEGFVAWAQTEAPELLRFKDPEPDKAGIKKAIKGGAEIPFARIEKSAKLKIE